MLREGRKGGMCLGKDKEEQYQEMGQEGQQGLGHGAGEWLLKVWGRQRCKQAWPDLNLPPTAVTATRCASENVGALGIHVGVSSSLCTCLSVSEISSGSKVWVDECQK